MLEINKIHLGDAYELIKQIPNKSIDLVYTDPPYLFYRGGVALTSPLAERKQVNVNEINPISDGIDINILNEFCRVLKTARMFIWCSNLQIPHYLKFFISRGYQYQILTWCKTNPIPATNGKWLDDVEFCIYASEPSAFRLNDGYDLKSKYHISPINQADKAKWEHPTIKPVELVQRHLKHASNEGELILDPFIGSGTTAVACMNTNRNYIGFEIDEKYYKIANDRLKGIDATGQLRLFPM